MANDSSSAAGSEKCHLALRGCPESSPGPQLAELTGPCVTSSLPTTLIRIFALLACTSVMAAVAKLGLSLAALPDTGVFQFNLQGYAALALPAFLFATTPLWMRGQLLGTNQIRNGIDGHFPPGTYNRLVHTSRPLQLLAAFAVVAGAACPLASHNFGAEPSGYGTGLFFVSAAVGFMICLLLLLLLLLLLRARARH